jgi:hypothetical protein
MNDVCVRLIIIKRHDIGMYVDLQICKPLAIYYACN